MKPASRAPRLPSLPKSWKNRKSSASARGEDAVLMDVRDNVEDGSWEKKSDLELWRRRFVVRDRPSVHELSSIVIITHLRGVLYKM